MKPQSTMLFRTLGLLALLAMPVASAAQGQNAQLPRYTIADLGTLGGTYSYAYGLNNARVVAGGAATEVQTGGIQQTAFLWHRGHMINLGTLGGAVCPDCSSEAGGPNSMGESALFSETSQPDPNGEDFCGFGTHRQCLAAIWKQARLTALQTLPGGNNAQAYWINNQGEVIGFSENDIPDSTCSSSVPFQVLRYQAVKWGPNGVPQPLPPLKTDTIDDTVSFGFGINDNGQAVGVSGLCSNVTLPPNGPPNGPHAVLWEKDGSVQDLGSLVSGATTNVPSGGINNRGEVAGGAQSSDGNGHAFLWTKHTGMQDLGTLPGDFVSAAPCCHTINNRSQVVGFSIPGPLGFGRAFLWQKGVMHDLNDLIPADSGWYLQFASSISDAGDIVGWGTINGEVHGFLATPRDGTHDLKGTTTKGPRVVSAENAHALLRQ